MKLRIKIWIICTLLFTVSFACNAQEIVLAWLSGPGNSYPAGASWQQSVSTAPARDRDSLSGKNPVPQAIVKFTSMIDNVIALPPYIYRQADELLPFGLSFDSPPVLLIEKHRDRISGAALREHPSDYDTGNFVEMSSGNWIPVSGRLSVVFDIPLYFYKISYHQRPDTPVFSDFSIREKSVLQGETLPLIYQFKIGMGIMF